MNVKVFSIWCLIVCAIKATPINTPDKIILQKLESLGLSFGDSFNYSEFILNLEDVIEQAQNVAVMAIRNIVDIAQGLARAVAKWGTEENLQEINNIQNNFFKSFEKVRQQAYNQNIDISSCVYDAIKKMHKEAEVSVSQITVKMHNITRIFSNLTNVAYVEPAKTNLAMSYSIREKIYGCPFSSKDFAPFYVCLATVAVIEDVALLNQFALSYNASVEAVQDLYSEFSEAASTFTNANVAAFNATVQRLFQDDFMSCAESAGYYS